MSRRAQRAIALLMLHHQHMAGGLPTVPPAIFSEACALPAEPLTWRERVRRWWRAVRDYCTFIVTDIDGGW